jgi:transposase-like protein
MKDRTAQLLAPPADFHDLETLVRGRVREMIVDILDEEVEGALGASHRERTQARTGYRHGSRPPRRLMTSFGPVEVEVPRATSSGATRGARGGWTRPWSRAT